MKGIEYLAAVIAIPCGYLGIGLLLAITGANAGGHKDSDVAREDRRMAGGDAARCVTVDTD